MRRSLLRASLLVLLTSLGCDEARTPQVAPTPAPVAMSSAVTASLDQPTAAAEAAPIRGEVLLVVLGNKRFGDDLVDAVEQALRDELQVEVRRLDPIPLPKEAYYAPRRRYRADTLLDHLLTLIPEEPRTTRVLGLTASDISTTKGDIKDWGIFGLGLVPGQAAVISSHRLKRSAKSRKHLRRRISITAVHEIGHTFGLHHCTESRCPMQDAEGSIRNTDTSTGHLGPECRAALEEGFPLGGTP